MIFKSYVICFYYFCKKLKYVLTCNYIIYNIYVKQFNQCIKNNNYLFHFSYYILCMNKNLLKMLIKSFTADSCVLSIDERKVQNIMFFKFLILLQDMLDFNLQI